jgi:predicted transposase YbfD/YdcC
MHLPTCPHQDKAFFELLTQNPDLDQRDNRGKRHSMPLVLMGVVMALLSDRDGNLSAIHRHLKNHFHALCLHLTIEATNAISRAQLARMLAQVNQPVLAGSVQQHYGLRLSEEFADWLSGDGKELRGSIAKGHKRGEVCVSIIVQADQAVVAQTHYNGTKESERPAIAKLLKDRLLIGKKIVLDALHLTPTLLDAIHHHQGRYLIGLKSNQSVLRRLCFIQTILHKPAFERVDAPERGHGRQDERQYACYTLVGLKLAPRWAKSGLTTVVVVTRVRRTLAGLEIGQTVSYFVSNEAVLTQTQAEALYVAIRGHWQIETMHYCRDMVLAEDDHRSKFMIIQRVMSGLRTLTLSLLQSLKPQNMTAQLQDFADNVQSLLDFLRLKRVL